MDRYTSRKFLLALGVICAATALRIAELLTSGDWVTSVGSALLFYQAANIGQKWAEK